MITLILGALESALTLFAHIWTAFNNAPMVKAKVDQMTQNEKDEINKLIAQAVTGSAQDRQAAMDKLRQLAAE